MKKTIKYIAVYLLGVATVVGLGAILSETGWLDEDVEGHLSEGEYPPGSFEGYRRFGLESKDEARAWVRQELGELLLWMPEQRLLLTVIRDDDDRPEKILMTQVDSGGVFEYHVEGPYGAPAMRYSGHWEPGPDLVRGGAWWDLNGDGLFDERLILGDNPKLQILIDVSDGKWIDAVKIGDAEDSPWKADSGTYCFSSEAGEWVKCDP